MRHSEKFDLEKGKWVKLEDMITSRKNAQAVCMPDGIYVLGGHDGVSYLKSCEKYDFNSKKWKQLPSMISSKSFFTAHSTHDCQYIYTFGGYDGRKILCSVER